MLGENSTGDNSHMDQTAATRSRQISMDTTCVCTRTVAAEEDVAPRHDGFCDAA